MKKYIVLQKYIHTCFGWQKISILKIFKNILLLYIFQTHKNALNNWIQTGMRTHLMLWNKSFYEEDKSRYNWNLEILTFSCATNSFLSNIYLESGNTFQTDVNSRKWIIIFILLPKWTKMELNTPYTYYMTNYYYICHIL